MEISTGLLMAMGLAVLVGFGAPIGYMIYCKKVLNASLVPVVAGITIYLAAVIGLESVIHSFLIYGANGTAEFINSHKAVLVIYLGLSAAFYEELGRWFGFKFMLRKYKKNDVSLVYGIGHGGAQIIMPVGINTAFTLYMLYSVKSAGMEAYLEMVGADEAESLTEMISSYTTVGAPYYIWTAVEMATVFAVQIGFSVLMFIAVRYAGKKYLYVVTILVHALFAGIGALYSTGMVENKSIIESICLVIAAAVAVYAFTEYKKIKGKDEV